MDLIKIAEQAFAIEKNYRITSYNVCYTKLLRTLFSIFPVSWIIFSAYAMRVVTVVIVAYSFSWLHVARRIFAFFCKMVLNTHLKNIIKIITARCSGCRRSIDGFKFAADLVVKYVICQIIGIRFVSIQSIRKRAVSIV